MFTIPLLNYSSKYGAYALKSNYDFEKKSDKKYINSVDNFNFGVQPKISNVSFGCVA